MNESFVYNELMVSKYIFKFTGSNYFFLADCVPNCLLDIYRSLHFNK